MHPNHHAPERLIALIEAAGYDPAPYSGRVMYGRRCVSFVAGPAAAATDVMADLGAESDDLAEYVATLRAVRMDEMGRDTVFHWPDVAWPAATDTAEDAR